MPVQGVLKYFSAGYAMISSTPSISGMPWKSRSSRASSATASSATQSTAPETSVTDRVCGSSARASPTATAEPGRQRSRSTAEPSRRSSSSPTTESIPDSRSRAARRATLRVGSFSTRPIRSQVARPFTCRAATTLRSTPSSGCIGLILMIAGSVRPKRTAL